MEILTLVSGGLLMAAGVFIGIYFCGGEVLQDECKETYLKEYAKNNGLYEPRKR